MRPQPVRTGIAGETPTTTKVGGTDRMLRAVTGAMLIALAVMGMIGPWGWIGLVPLATAAVGFCPLYSVLGFNTCATKKT